MLSVYSSPELTYFEFNIGLYSFMAFSLSDLLNSLPYSLKTVCLMQLN
jgi:hypothetical protein